MIDFLPAFLFATAFKEAFIEKNEKKKHRDAYDLSLVKSEQLKYSRVFITVYFICSNQNLPRSSDKYSPLIFYQDHFFKTWVMRLVKTGFKTVETNLP